MNPFKVDVTVVKCPCGDSVCRIHTLSVCSGFAGEGFKSKLEADYAANAINQHEIWATFLRRIMIGGNRALEKGSMLEVRKALELTVQLATTALNPP